ncbi:MAG: hypothetical protein K0R51_1562 [Cytophagaceae bacterium]|jgi:hypothetical protein|nr:hypothetical protein [Cytophagaceae bacterium]
MRELRVAVFNVSIKNKKSNYYIPVSRNNKPSGLSGDRPGSKGTLLHCFSALFLFLLFTRIAPKAQSSFQSADAWRTANRKNLF